ncbi:MAG: organomercurial lyase [Gammaproteobacteria bacterium]|nr:organomercurial lyase [Gammaproteobacteria bacterium]MDX2486571.1 organomercurial lyase [Gammaproteobacteria bacterium]
MNISESLQRLNGLLPLKARQDGLEPALKELHRNILRSFAAIGRPLSRAQIAEQVGADGVDDALMQLAENDLVVLSDDKQKVTGAYPFTVEERKHRVNVNGQDVYAMCALDALSVAPMCQASTRILSQCHVTDTPVEIQMNAAKVLLAQPEDVHVGIRWQSTSGCAAKNLCMEMVYLKDAATAQAWQQQDSENISIYALDEAVDFGAAFFNPLLAA